MGTYQSNLQNNINNYGQNAQTFAQQGNAKAGLVNENIGQGLQQAGQQASIATGNTGLSNQQQQTANQQGGTALSGVTQALGSIFSDEDLKENIKDMSTDSSSKLRLTDELSRFLSYAGSIPGAGSITIKRAAIPQLTSDGDQKIGITDLSGSGASGSGYDVPKFSIKGPIDQIKDAALRRRFPLRPRRPARRRPTMWPRGLTPPARPPLARLVRPRPSPLYRMRTPRPMFSPLP